jgi:drug/metabolite transporter (DMT)-like permease
VTAAVAAWVLHQRARLGFWLCAVAGSLLVVVFSVLRASQGGHGFGFEWADLLLVGAVVAASFGYIYGAQVTPSLGAERVICWVCVMALPVTLPATLAMWPQQPIATSAWMGFVYVGTFSMWIGFFAWYRGLALGGALRVSQTQLLQPFLSILASIPLLGEPLDVVTLGFAIAVVGTVVIGKRLSQPQAAPAAATPLPASVARPGRS